MITNPNWLKPKEKPYFHQISLDCIEKLVKCIERFNKGEIDADTSFKIEAFWKIAKNEFFYPNSFDSKEDIVLNLGNFLFEFNHLRKHGGLNYETPFDKLQRVTELLS